MAVFLFLCIATFVHSTSNVVLVRVNESHDTDQAKIIVSYDEKRIEIIDLDAFTEVKGNISKINVVVTRIINEEYSLVTSTTSLSGAYGYMVTTYTFIKNNK